MKISNSNYSKELLEACVEYDFAEREKIKYQEILSELLKIKLIERGDMKHYDEAKSKIRKRLAELEITSSDKAETIRRGT